MNKQKAIKLIQEINQGVFDGTGRPSVYIDSIVEIINQIEEPQKVTIPEFVADWIEECKHDRFYSLYSAFFNMDNRLKRWRVWGGHSELFARAWMDGYEVEERGTDGENKQEAIKLLQEITQEVSDNTGRYLVYIDKIVEIINQIGEPHRPQRVVVPKFVADWIEECKHDRFYALHGAFFNMDNELRISIWCLGSNNSELFARAWMDGYEVEKEKLYTIEIEGVDSGRLFKNIQTNKFLFHSGKGLKGYTNRLTETEIKQKDERLWQFAKEVK